VAARYVTGGFSQIGPLLAVPVFKRNSLFNL
jgi:hypothetical protein